MKLIRRDSQGKQDLLVLLDLNYLGDIFNLPPTTWEAILPNSVYSSMKDREKANSPDFTSSISHHNNKRKKNWRTSKLISSNLQQQRTLTESSLSPGGGGSPGFRQLSDAHGFLLGAGSIAFT